MCSLSHSSITFRRLLTTQFIRQQDRLLKEKERQPGNEGGASPELVKVRFFFSFVWSSVAFVFISWQSNDLLHRFTLFLSLRTWSNRYQISRENNLWCLLLMSNKVLDYSFHFALIQDQQTIIQTLLLLGWLNRGNLSHLVFLTLLGDEHLFLQIVS